MKLMKKAFAIILSVVMITEWSITTFAAGEVNYAGGVTDEMNYSSYWYDKTGVDQDKILMSSNEISQLNKDTLNADGANMHDLVDIVINNPTYNAASLRTSLGSASAGNSKYYVNGELLNNDEYFGKLKSAILETGFDEESRDVLYGVSIHIANLKTWPTNDIIGYSSDDTDDEFQSASMCVNEPFVIKQKCVVDGKAFYWGYSMNCSGWVCGDDIAICNNVEEWLDSWKVDVDGEDFLVVTGDKIILDKSIFTPYSSELELNIGSYLKLVPKNLVPSTIGERGTWNSYVVYLPTADENGYYVKKMALIPQHCNVSIGFLPLTQPNILDVAFSCLGNRYGWGGMLNAMDCSLYTRNVYRCFGLEIPRNTTWQKSVPGKAINLEGKTSAQKAAIIETLPAGALFYISGHTMIYTGNVDGTPYVISALGTVVDSIGPGNVINQYSVILNSVNVRRRNGSTWLDNITTAVVFANPEDFGTKTSLEVTLKEADIALEDGGSINVYLNGSIATVIRYDENENYLGSLLVLKAAKISHEEAGTVVINSISNADKIVIKENGSVSKIEMIDGNECITEYSELLTTTHQDVIVELNHSYVGNTCAICGKTMKNGLIYNKNNWYYYVNDEVDTNKTDIIYHNNVWYYVENGALNKEYAGLVNHDGILWYVSEGKLNKNYKGLVNYNDDLMFVKDGKFTKSSGVWTENGLKYWVVNGLVDSSVNGLKYVDNTWVYFKDGIENKTVETLVWTNGAWWYVNKGTLDKSYTGLVNYSGKLWYVTNGKLNKEFAGNCEYNGKNYSVANGIGSLS